MGALQCKVPERGEGGGVKVILAWINLSCKGDTRCEQKVGKLQLREFSWGPYSKSALLPHSLRFCPVPWAAGTPQRSSVDGLFSGRDNRDAEETKTNGLRLFVTWSRGLVLLSWRKLLHQLSAEEPVKSLQHTLPHSAAPSHESEGNQFMALILCLDERLNWKVLLHESFLLPSAPLTVHAQSWHLLTLADLQTRSR